MGEKFYHTYFKSGNKRSIAYLFRIKEGDIHFVSRNNTQVDIDRIIPSIDIDNIADAILDKSLSDKENIRKVYHLLLPAEDLSNLIICKSALNQGEYYPNIYRPIFSKRHTFPTPSTIDLKAYLSLFDQTEYISRLNQLKIIYHDLSDIFKYVEPDNNDNMKAYGHRIRNNIILSCTEIDSMFQNLMLKNGYKKKEYRFSTNDYFKTKTVLKLDEYEISFTRHLNISLFSPFAQWNNIEGNGTTQTLTWYDAYNKIKHDRIKNKKLANLKNAVDAFSAAIILFISQYGDDEPFWKKDFGDEIIIKQKPHYEYNEFYLPPISSENISWTEKQYTFK